MEQFIFDHYRAANRLQNIFRWCIESTYFTIHDLVKNGGLAERPKALPC